MPVELPIQAASMLPAQEEPIDYARLMAVSFWALSRYDLTEWEMRISQKVIFFSFAQGRPFFPLPQKTMLAQMVGMTRSNLGAGLSRLTTKRIIQETQVGGQWILTFMPPSREWPWIGVDSRLPTPAIEGAADETERFLLRLGRIWPEQGELFGPEVEHELQDALALERMRASILTAHQRAVAAGGSSRVTPPDFPVKDRSSTAPAEKASSGGTENATAGVMGEPSQGSSHDLSEGAAAKEAETATDSTPSLAPAGNGTSSQPEQSGPLNLHEQIAASLGETPVLENNTPAQPPVLENNTGVGKQHSALNSFKASELSKDNSQTLKLSKLGVGKQHQPPHLDFLDPGSSENDMVRWLVRVLGVPIMDQWGGRWRNAWREDQNAVLNACYELKLRLADPIAPRLKNPGGWLRDKYNTIHKENTRPPAA